MRAIRGAKIGMIFQDSLAGLHPCYRVGWQIVEMIRLHDHEISKDQARQRAVELLRLVGIRNRSSGCTITRTSSPAGCASAR
jgi:peptide/nickel transport system ATP-binding protein